MVLWDLFDIYGVMVMFGVDLEKICFFVGVRLDLLLDKCFDIVDVLYGIYWWLYGYVDEFLVEFEVSLYVNVSVVFCIVNDGKI